MPIEQNAFPDPLFDFSPSEKLKLQQDLTRARPQTELEKDYSESPFGGIVAGARNSTTGAIVMRGVQIATDFFDPQGSQDPLNFQPRSETKSTDPFSWGQDNNLDSIATDLQRVPKTEWGYLLASSNYKEYAAKRDFVMLGLPETQANIKGNVALGSMLGTFADVTAMVAIGAAVEPLALAGLGARTTMAGEAVFKESTGFGIRSLAQTVTSAANTVGRTNLTFRHGALMMAQEGMFIAVKEGIDPNYHPDASTILHDLVVAGSIGGIAGGLVFGRTMLRSSIMEAAEQLKRTKVINLPGGFTLHSIPDLPFSSTANADKVLFATSGAANADELGASLHADWEKTGDMFAPGTRTTSGATPVISGGAVGGTVDSLGNVTNFPPFIEATSARLSKKGVWQRPLYAATDFGKRLFHTMSSPDDLLAMLKGNLLEKRKFTFRLSAVDGPIRAEFEAEKLTARVAGTFTDTPLPNPSMGSTPARAGYDAANVSLDVESNARTITKRLKSVTVKVSQVTEQQLMDLRNGMMAAGLKELPQVGDEIRFMRPGSKIKRPKMLVRGAQSTVKTVVAALGDLGIPIDEALFKSVTRGVLAAEQSRLTGTAFNAKLWEEVSREVGIASHVESIATAIKGNALPRFGTVDRNVLDVATRENMITSVFEGFRKNMHLDPTNPKSLIFEVLQQIKDRGGQVTRTTVGEVVDELRMVVNNPAKRLNANGRRTLDRTARRTAVAEIINKRVPDTGTPIDIPQSYFKNLGPLAREAKAGGTLYAKSGPGKVATTDPNYPVQRGMAAMQDRIQRLAQTVNKKTGKPYLTTDEARVMTRLMERLGPDNFANFGLRIRDIANMDGSFDFLRDVVTITNTAMNGGRFSKTFVHEIWHAFTGYIDNSMLVRMNKDYVKAVKKMHLKNGVKWDDAWGSNQADLQKAVYQLGVQRPNIPFDDLYQLTNLDEWVVGNLTSSTLKRLKLEKDTKNVFGYLRLMMENASVEIRAVFGAAKYDKLTKDWMNGRYRVARAQIPQNATLTGAARQARNRLGRAPGNFKNGMAGWLKGNQATPGGPQGMFGPLPSNVMYAMFDDTPRTTLHLGPLSNVLNQAALAMQSENGMVRYMANISFNARRVGDDAQATTLFEHGIQMVQSVLYHFTTGYRNGYTKFAMEAQGNATPASELNLFHALAARWGAKNKAVRQEFDTRVIKVLRSGTADSNLAVNETAKGVQKIFQRLHEVAFEAGVPGFMNGAVLNYMPRLWRFDHIRRLASTPAGMADLTSLIENALGRSGRKVVIDGVETTFTGDVREAAVVFAERLKNIALETENAPLMAQDQELFEALGALLGPIKPNTSSPTPFGKGRVLLDEGSSVALTADHLGNGSATLSISDLLHNNLPMVLKRYTTSVMGAVNERKFLNAMNDALIAKGAVGPTETLANGTTQVLPFERITSIDKMFAMARKVNGAILPKHEKGLREVMAAMTFEPLHSGTTQFSDQAKGILMAYGYLLKGGQFGLAQLGETARVVGTFGLVKTINQLPILTEMVTNWHNLDRPTQNFASWIDTWMSPSTDRLRREFLSVGLDTLSEGPGTLGRARQGLDVAANLLSDISGLAPLTSWTQQLTAAASMQHLWEAARGGARLDAATLKGLGLTTAQYDTLISYVGTNALTKAGFLGERIVGMQNMSMNKIEMDLLRDFVDRAIKTRIQDMPTRGDFAKSLFGFWGSAATQFRSFNLKGVDNFLLQNIGRVQQGGGKRVAAEIGSTLIFSGMIAYGRNYADWRSYQASNDFKKADEVAKTLTKDGFIRGALAGPSEFFLAILGVDAAWKHTVSEDPLFSQYRYSGQSTFGVPLEDTLVRTYGLAEDLYGATVGRATGSSLEREMTQRTLHSFRLMLPAQNLPGLKQFFNIQESELSDYLRLRPTQPRDR
jgi:hypothetical protein